MTTKSEFQEWLDSVLPEWTGRGNIREAYHAGAVRAAEKVLELAEKKAFEAVEERGVRGWKLIRIADLVALVRGES